MMKKYLLLAPLILTLVTSFIHFAEASTRIRGYYKPSADTYVAPHFRSNPNSTRWDNYSNQGNYNPFTGKKGYTSPNKPYRFR